jgi:hypothetical protein
MPSKARTSRRGSGLGSLGKDSFSKTISKHPRSKNPIPHVALDFAIKNVGFGV